MSFRHGGSTAETIGVPDARGGDHPIANIEDACKTSSGDRLTNPACFLMFKHGGGWRWPAEHVTLWSGTMKKLSYVLLVAVSALFFCACGSDKEDDSAGSGGTATAGSGGQAGSYFATGGIGGNGAVPGGGTGATDGGAAGGTGATDGGVAGGTGATDGGVTGGTGGTAGAPIGGASGAAGAGTGGVAGIEPFDGGTADGGGVGGGGGGGGGGAGAGGTGATGGSGVVDGGYAENTGADCDVYAGELARNPNLPDPFAMNDGTRISTMAEWACRRNEIKKDIERYEIGTKPEPPTVQASLSGSTLNVTVTTNAGSLTLTSNVGPASGSGPHCVAIGMNANSSMINGCVQVPFMHNQVVTNDHSSSTQWQSDGFYQVYPELFGQIGNYVAWSWGISRLIDGLDQVKEELNIDMTKIGVHGCSYAGKMALFAGAFDERVALTIAQESGGGGITSWRLSQDFTNRTGINVEKIDNTNYAWFLSGMRTRDPYSLPHDHHELIAMIAPRAVVAFGNPPWEWMGDESGYKSLMAAREVWKAMGIEDRIGFDFTGGSTHCMPSVSQTDTANAFVNRFLKGQSADTNITIEPNQPGFDLNYSAAIDWESPALN